MLDKVQRLILDTDMCVLATSRQGRPYCSLMAYACGREGKGIYMVTGRGTKKFSNIMENPYVSLMIDTRERHGRDGRSKTLALTVEGRCRRVEDADERKEALEDLTRRHPSIISLAKSADAEVICVSISSYLLLEGLDSAFFEEIEGK